MTRLHIVVFFDVFCTECGFDVRKEGTYSCECETSNFFNWVQKPALLEECFFYKNWLLVGEEAERAYLLTSSSYRKNTFSLKD